MAPFSVNAKNPYSNEEPVFENSKVQTNTFDQQPSKEKKTELLYDGIYYDITGWMKMHPGGKIIEMFASTEQDALHAIQQFHFRSDKKVMSIMKSLPQRKPTEDEYSKIISKDAEKNNSLTKDFLQLFSELKSEGYFEPSPWHIAGRYLDLLILLGVGHFIYFSSTNMVLSILGLFVLGIGYGRAAMLCHECGHHSMTGNPDVDRRILGLTFGFAFGLSGSYWISQHSRHHAIPSHIIHDIDMQTLPLMAFNKKVVKNAKDGQTFLIRNQKWLFFINTLVVTFFWKIYLHPRYAFHKGKYSELVAMSVHAFVFVWLYGVSNALFILWVASTFLLGNFSLNHTHLPISEDPKHWVEQTLLHTANIKSSYFGWTDYWMGNLNHQIEHHLFPVMPQYRNKFMRERVKALAKKHNLPYILMSYSEACSKALNNLENVARELNEI